MVVGDRAASVMQLIAPNPVAEIHASEDIATGEIRQDPPDGRLVVAPGGQKFHDLLMRHRSPLLMQRHKHGYPRSRSAHSLRMEERSHLTAHSLKMLQSAGLQVVCSTRCICTNLLGATRTSPISTDYSTSTTNVI